MNILFVIIHLIIEVREISVINIERRGFLFGAAATAVAANYAEATVPASRKDFANKMSIALKELVESRMWLYIIGKREYVRPAQLAKLFDETDELVRIFNASISTARKRLSDNE